MLHYEALRLLSHERGERLRRQAEAERLAMQMRSRRQRGRRRLALDATLELLLRGRRDARHQGTHA